MERDLQILSGEQKVRMNGFVKKIVLNTLLALIGSLDEVDMEGELRVVIGPSARAPPDSAILLGGLPPPHGRSRPPAPPLSGLLVPTSLPWRCQWSRSSSS